MSTAKVYTPPFYLFPLAAATVAWLVCQQLQPVDQPLFGSLLAAAGVHDVHPADAALDQVMMVLYVVAAVYGGFAAWFRLASSRRMIVTAQVFVALFLVQCVLGATVGLSGHPIGYSFALFLGVVLGYACKEFKRREERYQAQYYELELRNREILETRMQIIKQDEIERRTLAADLHDQVLNDLKALGQTFAEYRAAPRSDKEKTIERHLAQAVANVREVMDTLCPSVLEHLGLVAAIEDCLRAGSERGGFKVRFKNQVDGDKLQQLSMVESSLLYRLVQESVTNICKHAHAETVRGAVECNTNKLTVTIADDGAGMDPAQSQGDSRGLRYMRQRADLIGATINWARGEGDRGTVVEVTLDLSGRDGGSHSDH